MTDVDTAPDAPAPLPAPVPGNRITRWFATQRRAWDWYQIRKEVVVALAVGTTLVLSVVGMVSLLSDDPKPVVIDTRTEPDLIARAYASQVAQVFTTFDPATAKQRADLVARLVPGAPTNLGWDGRSTSTGTPVAILGDSPDTDTRVVSVYVATSDGPRTVIVRVRKDPSGAPQLVGLPTFGAAPRAADMDQTVPQDAAANGLDLVATQAAAPTVSGFLSAWGAGDPAQSVYAADGFQIPPGPGGLRLIGTPSFTLPDGGNVRQVTVYVRWVSASGATYPSAYQLTLVRGAQRWSVQAITAAPAGRFAAVPST